MHKSQTPSRSIKQRNSAISSISANVTNSAKDNQRRQNRLADKDYATNPYNLDISKRIGKRYNKAMRMSSHVETEADVGKDDKKSVFDNNKRYNS